ncbi:branched-chain amino acid ABC transporter permease [Fluviispira sanaruensis]|uniref:Branched-chain amino acid ABC transporter permease n=1 Tax=Fluviispira sanaruensis TaxID=2493639 RepID=A0A4P2VKG9_FLUSA|nr:branched-chain amino acid ABC transporter permease [Fluviispira sanaruensis]BBH52394.1 branched-chain amino acid ABC transporter permease [Fluviispira sanaruensis]
MIDFLNYSQLPFIMFSILAIQAMSLQLILGGTGLLSLGHAAFYTVGGYTSAMFTVFLAPLLGIHDSTLLLICACLVGMIAAAFTGLIVAIPCLKLRGDYLAMATLGVGEIVATFFKNLDFVGGTRGFKDIPKLGSPLLIFSIMLLTFLFIKRFYKTNLGYAVRATRDDEISARSLGINIYKTKLISFLLGSSLAGLAGVFYAHTLQFISPDEAGFYNSVVLVLAVVIGGMYSVFGSIFGAFIIVIIPEILRFIPQLINPYLLIMSDKGLLLPSLIPIIDSILSNRTLIFSVLVVFIMLLNPKGVASLFERINKMRKTND